MKTGLELIGEQMRELEGAGLTGEQQDLATQGQLAGAAACYALTVAYYFGNGRQIVAGIWPLMDELFEREAADVVKLARAGALIAMELERVQRAGERLEQAVRADKPLLLLPPNGRGKE